MRKGKMTRDQAVAICGESVVDQVESKNCDFTGALMDAGDTAVEFAASVEFEDAEGYDKVLTVYYYQEQESVDEVDDLDQLNWEIAGYEIY